MWLANFKICDIKASIKYYAHLWWYQHFNLQCSIIFYIYIYIYLKIYYIYYNKIRQIYFLEEETIN